MKKNNLLKVLSAAAIASTLAIVDYSTDNITKNYTHAAETTSKVVTVPATLKHFYNGGPSMGSAALEKVTVQKVGNNYKYSVYWKDLVFNGFSDGVSKFWVDGKEVALTPTTKIQGTNPKVAEFTLSELKDKIEIEVFVQVMENIMQGGGRQKAYLQLDTSTAKAELEKKEETTQPANNSSQSGDQSTPANNGTRPGNQAGNNTGGRPTFTPPAPGPQQTKAVESNGILFNEVTLTQGDAKFMNDSNSSAPSSYNPALEKVTIKRVGNKFEYTLQVKKAETTTPRGNSAFELTKIFYNNLNTPLPFTVVDAATSTKTVKFTTDRLYSTLPLRAATEYFPGVEAQHNIALVLNLDEKLSKPSNNNNPIITPGGNPGNPTPPPTNPGGQSGPKVSGADVTYFTGLRASLMHASQPGRPSMGNAALNRVVAFEQDGVYHYVLYFTNINVGQLSDGITRFWVNGSELSVVKTGGANNEVRVHFTNSQKLTQIPVSVFVQTMENIMPGGGKQDAILTFDWSNVQEEKGKAPLDLNSGSAVNAGGNSNSLTPTGGRFNNGRLANTGLETSSSIFAGIATLFAAIFLGRKRQK